MTGLLIRALGLVASGNLHPNYYVENEIVMEERLYDERERNYQNEQEQIIIEDYFLFMEQIGKINYARGCAGSYTPPVRSEEQNKRLKCGVKSFDCSGLIKGYGVAKGLLSSKELGKYNSQSLMDLATKKDGMVAKRGDWTSWKGVDGTHFAIVSREYEGDGILWVYDNVNGPNNNLLKERPLKVRYSQGKFIYIGKRVIEVYTNGYVDLAREERIHVESWQIIEQLPEELPTIDSSNPHQYSVLVSGYDYDSDANKIASYRRDNGGSQKMIAKFMGEAHFKTNKLGKKGEEGLCQLMPNKTNNVWLKDPRRNEGREFQAKICLEKWEAVPDPDKIWFANHNLYMDKIIFLD